jgi:hypothetical protein
MLSLKPLTRSSEKGPDLNGLPLERTLMQSTQLSFDLVTGYNLRWIGLGSLDRDLYPVRGRKREIAFDDWTGKIVEFFEYVRSTIIEIGLPMPRGMTTGTRSANLR